jgi:hypothetical protein
LVQHLKNIFTGYFTSKLPGESLKPGIGKVTGFKFLHEHRKNVYLGMSPACGESQKKEKESAKQNGGFDVRVMNYDHIGDGSFGVIIELPF